MDATVWSRDLASDKCLQDILGVTLWHKCRNADVLRETEEHSIEH